jgi:hypothetical protein
VVSCQLLFSHELPLQLSGEHGVIPGSTTFIDTLTCTDDCANLITAYVQTCADYVTAKGHPQLMDSLLVLGEVCEATVVSGN